MNFTTIDFALFFAIVFAVNWCIRRWAPAWKWFMLAASLFFYGYWDKRFVLLLLGSSVLNHLVAGGLTRLPRGWRRRSLLALAVSLNLGSIAFFKYAGFLLRECFSVLLRFTPEADLEALYALWFPRLDFASGIILPVGISFFTFQALSYVTDVYRGRMKPADSLLDFALYLSFFPQLVAGPIVRAVDLIGQVARPVIPARIDLSRAAFLILGGLFKKIVVANFLAERIVDPVFARPDLYGTWDTLFAVYAYAIQIYCDFSAYSDMAIGFCLLLGFHIPLNFDAPYLSTSIQKFWRRWHISLSFFLRDYLYIPLGGSRKGGELSVHRNLLITFLLGGLWHGAGWTFIAWGALHGVYLIVERAYAGWAAGREKKPGGWALTFFQRCMVWHLVCFSWLFFRCQTFSESREMLRALTRLEATPLILGSGVGFMILLGYLTQYLDGSRLEPLWDRVARLHPVALGAVSALVLTVILALGPKGVAPFIYFQF